MVVAIERLAVLNPQAGGISEEAEAELRRILQGFEFVSLPEGRSVAELLAGTALAPGATVMVAGGDGTVGAAARSLAGTDRVLGILPLGTYNNFARALGIPLEPGRAAAALLRGRRRSVTLGSAGGRPFLEAASVGLFGDLINLGEAAKERRYGELLERVRELSAPAFEYRISGDLQAAGRARAIVVANTPSTGALVPVGSVTPEEPVLELTILPVGARAEILRRLASRALPFLNRPRPGRRVRRVRIETEPVVGVYADAERAGESPTDIAADPLALRVILPG